MHIVTFAALFKYSWPLANLHIANVVAINREAYRGADFVESILSRRTRIDVQKLIDWVEHHFQNVRMTRNENIGLGTLNHSYGRRGVVARIASYVGD